MNTDELFIDANKLPKPLPKSQVNELLDKVKQGDENAIKMIIEHNIRLVLYEVNNRFKSVEYDKKDLVSIGNVGLMKAVTTFDKSKKVEFATYATRCIDNEILMYFRSTKKLSAEVYLEDTIGKDKDDNTVSLQEVLENNERSVDEEVDLKFKIKKLYAKMKTVLKDREFGIITMRFGLDGKKPRTQEQIAKMLGISRSYVSRIETKAIGKLAKEFKERIN